MWRDASKGLINGRRPEDLVPLGDADDSDSDQSDQENEQSVAADKTSRNRVEARSTSPPTRPPSSASERPSSVAPDVDNDFDIDEIIREDEERQAAAARATNSSRPPHHSSQQPQPGPSRPPPQTQEIDEDQEMWDQLDGGFDDEVVMQTPPAVRANEDVEDEDMWDLVREIEESGGSSASKPPPAASAHVPAPTATTAQGAPPAPAQAQDPPQPATNDEGWDEMYL